jgi:hypothetical protein
VKAILAFLLLFQFNAQAKVLREDIGELKIHDLLIRPNFLLKEPSTGSFTIGESSFALRWELEQKFAGVIRIGPRSLMNIPARYESQPDNDVMLVEGFAEYDDPYGRIRLGRIPIEFGYEGKLWERELIFPRSLFFQNRAMILRDVGLSYEIQHNGFLTGFAIHNGEGDTDKDGQIWYTARWGYRADKFEVGLSGQTGLTHPSATATSGDALAGVDPTKNAKWRIGGVYAAISGRRTEWVMEVNGGERQQEKKIGKFSAWHTDFGYQINKTISGHLRYDVMDPNQSVGGDMQKQASLAVVLSNGTKSSNLILIGTKCIEDGHQIANDELRLIWSLSPSGVVRF